MASRRMALSRGLGPFRVVNAQTGAVRCYASNAQDGESRLRRWEEAESETWWQLEEFRDGRWTPLD